MCQQLSWNEILTIDGGKGYLSRYVTERFNKRYDSKLKEINFVAFLRLKKLIL